jgi:hypothetical protein
MAISRDALVWLEGLDLSYAVRNPTRDLSNGFIVAEILCKHHPHDISLHSFSAGMKLSIKEDNWMQIRKFMLKKGIHELSTSEISDIVNQNTDTICLIIEKLYRRFSGIVDSELTNCVSENREFHSKSPQKQQPRYALPTASFKVKDSFIDRTADDMERKLRRVKLIIEHESRQEEGPLFSPKETLSDIVKVFDLSNTKYIVSPPLVHVNTLWSVME